MSKHSLYNYVYVNCPHCNMVNNLPSIPQGEVFLEAFNLQDVPFKVLIGTSGQSVKCYGCNKIYSLYINCQYYTQVILADHPIQAQYIKLNSPRK